MMKTFKKRGALTHFQILSEISKQDPHLKQKDLANKLGITIQAVSENIKTLIELGYISSKDGRSPYKITQKGIEKVFISVGLLAIIIISGVVYVNS